MSHVAGGGVTVVTEVYDGRVVSRSGLHYRVLGGRNAGAVMTCAGLF